LLRTEDWATQAGNEVELRVGHQFQEFFFWCYWDVDDSVPARLFVAAAPT